MVNEDKINRVAIVGGVHGNELTGIYLIKKFDRSTELIKRQTFETVTLLANPRAFQLGKRYCDRDLNRCFQSQDLDNPNLNGYEDARAKEIKNLWGNDLDFLIDIHSTTSQAGMMIILDKGFESDPLILNLVSDLSQINPLVQCFFWSNTQPQNRLRSISKRSITIEVGAIAHNTLNYDYFQQTELLIFKILDFLDNYNRQKIDPIIPQLTIFEGQELINYPHTPNTNELIGMIHPKLISQDYQPLNPGDPLFIDFHGKAIAYKGNSTVYPVFIGEASYKEKGIAMVFCSKQEIAF